MSGIKPTIGDVLQVRIYCYTPKQMAVNTLHYYVPTAPVTFGATLQEIATALNTLVAPLYKQLMPAEARYRGLSVQNLTPPMTVTYKDTSLDGAGTGTNGLLPTQVCGLIHIKSLNAGPSGRGRIYMPFIDRGDDTTSGSPGGSYLTALLTLCLALGITDTIVGATGSTRIDLVIRRKQAGPIAFQVASSIEPGTKWATQRKRGEYGHLNPTPLP